MQVNYKREQLKELIEKSVTYELEISAELDSPEHHFDFQEDIQYVLKEIASGNTWAWFNAEMKASVHFPLLDMSFSASDYLGACSYKSEDDFKKDAYYDGMKSQSLDLLVDKIFSYLYSADQLKNYLKLD